MWIRSQDRGKLLELKDSVRLVAKVVYQFPNPCEDGMFITVDYEEVGHYQTKERATEVLNELINHISSGHKIYHMPKE